MSTSAEGDVGKKKHFYLSLISDYAHNYMRVNTLKYCFKFIKMQWKHTEMGETRRGLSRFLKV